MKIWIWILISVLLHTGVFTSMWVASLKDRNKKKDITYVMIREYHVPVKNPPKVVTPPKEIPQQKELGAVRISDKITPETNAQETVASSGDYTGDYVPFYQVEELPQALSPINPPYPEEARRLGVEGRVLVLIYIDDKGVVRKIDVQKSPHEVLTQAAMKAISNVRFRPAKIGGIAKAVCMQFALRFRLE